MQQTALEVEYDSFIFRKAGGWARRGIVLDLDL